MKGQVIYIFLICSLEFISLKEECFRTNQIPEKNTDLEDVGLESGKTLKIIYSFT